MGSCDKGDLKRFEARLLKERDRDEKRNYARSVSRSLLSETVLAHSIVVEQNPGIRGIRFPETEGS